VPTCNSTVVASEASRSSNSSANKAKCPSLEIGKNSVMPCTRPSPSAVDSSSRMLIGGRR
jgi:hypothetical protein